VGVIGGVVALIVLGLYLSDPARRIDRAVQRESVRLDYRTPAESLEPAEVWISRSESELKALKESNETLRRELESLSAAVRRFQDTEGLWNEARRNRQASSPPFEPEPAVDGDWPPDPEPPSEPAANRLLPVPPPPPRPAGVVGGAGQGLAPGILVVDVAPLAVKGQPAASGMRGQDTPGRESAVTGGRHRREFLPAGSFVTAALLAGLDAPTGGLAKTNPQPVLLSLLDQGQLPNRFRSRVKDCFVTAAGYGDLASERAYLRLEKLACVLRDGTVIELGTQGYVVGEDGKAGLRGRVVSKQGRLIALSLVSGVASGIGDAVSQSFTSISTNPLGSVQTVNPEAIAQYGVGQGFAKALDRIAEWYLDRANEIYPVIEVDSGRVVEVVLTDGLDLGVDLFKQARRTE
jgi:conjugal transfer pilus assembly protein TraB